MRILKIFRKIVVCYWQAMIRTVNHDGIEHAGYLAFLLMLAIFPFIVFASLLLSFLSKWYLNSYIMLSSFVKMIFDGPWSSFIFALKPRIQEISTTPPQSFLTIAIISGIWTASSIFEGLRTILNRAYHVTRPPSYLVRRVLSIIEFIVILITITFLLFFLEILPSIIESIHNFIIKEKMGSIFDPIMNLLFHTESVRFLVVILLSFLVTSYFYYFLPNIKQRFVDTFPGAITTMICWWFFSRVFKYYITIFPQINLIYGSIAGIIICLLYFYACSFIFIFGGELNFLIKENLLKLKKQ